jgi:hypothetical protein
MKTYVFSTFTVLMLMMCSSLAWGQRTMQQRSKVNKPANPVLYEQTPAATTTAPVVEPVNTNIYNIEANQVQNSTYRGSNVAQYLTSAPVTFYYKDGTTVDFREGTYKWPYYVTGECSVDYATAKSNRLYNQGDLQTTLIAEGWGVKCYSHKYNGTQTEETFESKPGTSKNHSLPFLSHFSAMVIYRLKSPPPVSNHPGNYQLVRFGSYSYGSYAHMWGGGATGLYGKPLTQEQIEFNHSAAVNSINGREIKDTSFKCALGQSLDVYVLEGLLLYVEFYDGTNVTFETKKGENPNKTFIADGRMVRQISYVIF